MAKTKRDTWFDQKWKLVELLEQYDGCCMDNAEERAIVAQAIVDRFRLTKRRTPRV